MARTHTGFEMRKGDWVSLPAVGASPEREVQITRITHDARTMALTPSVPGTIHYRDARGHTGQTSSGRAKPLERRQTSGKFKLGDRVQHQRTHEQGTVSNIDPNGRIWVRYSDRAYGSGAHADFRKLRT
jgi:hypothetical protein